MVASICDLGTCPWHHNTRAAGPIQERLTADYTFFFPWPHRRCRSLRFVLQPEKQGENAMDAIEKLQAERQRLVARLSEIDKILSRFDELQRIAERFFTTEAPHTGHHDGSNDSVVASTSHLDQNPEVSSGDSLAPIKPKTPMSVFVDTVLKVLAGAEQPLDRSALYAELLNRHIVIGSPDESADLNTLSARMSRMSEKVTNIKGYGYWLKDRAFLEGGYRPSSDYEVPIPRGAGADIFE